MKSLMLIVALAFVLGMAYSGPVELTDSNFNTYMKENPSHVLFVDFFAPWCGHCKRLEPVWDELAAEFEGQEVNTDGRVYRAAKLDATVHKATASAYKITGYPTLLLFRDGATYRYRGPRTKDKLIEFAQYGYQEAETVRAVKVDSEVTIMDVFEDYKEVVLKAAKQIPNLWTNYQKGFLVLVLFSALIGIMLTLIACFSPPKVVTESRKQD